MSNDKLIGAEELAKRIKMAVEGVKKKPGLMKSTAGYMELVHTYVNRIVTAKDEGKWVATHGTQQPLEIYEAMDVRGLFIEFWGVISDVVKLESVPEALNISASTGTPGEVCSFFRNMDGLMHAGMWPKTDFMLGHGYIKNDFDVHEWAAPEFLQQAAKELLEERWKSVTAAKLPEATALRLG